MPIMSLDMSTLQADLEQSPPGSEVHVSVLTQNPPSEQQIRELTDSFVSSGIEMRSPPRAITMAWDGYEISAVDLNFKMPAAPAPDTVGLLPLLIFAGIAALGFGYVLWKGGNIAEETTQNLVKLIIPMTLIIGGIYLVSTMSKRSA
jgi:hypothetical protein